MQPILGLDFLVSHGLIVDPKNKILIDSNTNVRIPLKCTHQTFSAYSIDYHNVDPRAQELLLQFPTLTAPLNLHKTPATVPKKNFHKIDTSDHHPVHLKARPLTGRKLQAAKDEFKFLLEA